MCVLVLIYYIFKAKLAVTTYKKIGENTNESVTT